MQIKLTILIFLSFCISGCAHHVVIHNLSSATVQGFSEVSQIKPFPNMSDVAKWHGPYLEVVISSQSNIEKMAEKYTHHLYFNLQPCSENDLTYSLWSGGIFMTNVENQYKLYIPINFELLQRNASIFGALNVNEYFNKVKKDGLCIVLGGGLIGGTYLISNKIKAPLYINEKNELIVK